MYQTVPELWRGHRVQGGAAGSELRSARFSWAGGRVFLEVVPAFKMLILNT
jgi:hypothetical protein